ncbi:MAG: 4Fe-4S cluster-binding domain-containing protein [Spirochaetales bacterium]|nr:4Fe-4S cluster-binding domain-containing protein [Spirochaetales bacterium]
MPNLLSWLQHCNVCPNFCEVDRLRGKKGKCRSGRDIVISSANLHYGEEPVLVGKGGSGTIFFTACNLSCVFCQNYDISQLDYGKTISRQELITIMFHLQLRGAENINLVSPTHQAPQIFEAIVTARKKGLRLPVVYNCGGYENPDFIRELDGLVDIYMPDFKYGRNEAGERYSCVKQYTDYCMKSLLEMQRQVGSLKLDASHVARRGLLVRHLVLPEGTAFSKEVIDFIADSISVDTYLNIMDQYRPAYNAADYPPLKRRPFRYEIDEVAEYAKKRGLKRILC